MRKALLIINESSGDKQPNRDKIGRIRELLEPVGLDLEILLASAENDPTDRLRQAVKTGVDAVIVGGGDGTVGPIASELVGERTVLGVLPLGTYNNIARSIGVPTDLDQACAIIAEGAVKKIDVGITPEGKYFFEAAGGGLDASLFPLGEEIKGGRWSRLVQFAQLTMKYAEQRVVLTFDRPVAEAIATGSRHRYKRKTLQGKSVAVRAMIVAIANGPYYGGGFTVAPSARLDDGLLTIVVYRRFSKLELIRHFLSISRGQRHYSPKIETFMAKEVHIVSRESLELHADGIPCGEAPADFKCLPSALQIYSPRA